MKVPELPKQLQDFVSLTKYEFSFKNTRKIQPIEHTDDYNYWSSVWGWQDTNGEIHRWDEEDEDLN